MLTYGLTYTNILSLQHSLLFNNFNLHVNIKYAMSSYVLVKITLVTPYLSCITVAVVDTGVVTLVQPL